MKTKSVDLQVRPSAIAGTWYPGEARVLAATIDDLLGQVSIPPTPDQLIALVSPHAGYAFSGQTAAHAYAQLRGHNFETVVLIGPSHHADFGPFAISAFQCYSTPLGNVELDQDFVAALERQVQVQRIPSDNEHSLEIQLPFLQRTLGEFKLVPILMSRPFYLVGPEAREYCNQLANALAEAAAGRRVLLVASSDLSHLEDYYSVRKFDARFAQLIEKFEIDPLADYMWRTGECRACGDAPIITTLLAAQKLGANQVRILQQTNSGDVTGERERANYVVGYLAAGVYKTRQ